eukprot:3938836-Rhodomonas_salina.1
MTNPLPPCRTMLAVRHRRNHRRKAGAHGGNLAPCPCSPTAVHPDLIVVVPGLGGEEGRNPVPSLGACLSVAAGPELLGLCLGPGHVCLGQVPDPEAGRANEDSRVSRIDSETIADVGQRGESTRLCPLPLKHNSR